jgi:hypothetical protein
MEGRVGTLTIQQVIVQLISHKSADECFLREVVKAVTKVLVLLECAGSSLLFNTFTGISYSCKVNPTHMEWNEKPGVE